MMLLKLKNSNCDLTKKTCIVTSQKLKVWQKIKNSKYDNSKTRNVAKLRNSNSDKTQAFILWQTQKLKFWQNIKTQIGQDLKTQIVTKLKNNNNSNNDNSKSCILTKLQLYIDVVHGLLKVMGSICRNGSAKNGVACRRPESQLRLFWKCSRLLVDFLNPK